MKLIIGVFLVLILLVLIVPNGWVKLAIIVLGYIVLRKIYKKYSEETSYPIFFDKTVKQRENYNRSLNMDSDFNPDEFLDKVRIAFISIQDAWSKKDLSNVRRYISDGIYQRFNTQFRIMELLKERDIISDVSVKSMSISQIERAWDYDIIHVQIEAKIKEQFICETMHSLNALVGIYKEFIEYWTFIRKRGQPKKDIFHTDNCPNCSAQLPKNMADVVQCSYCGSLINSGQFDWILSEITQADDYVFETFRYQKTRDLNDKIRTLIAENKDFSVAQIEDKVSNGYLQILTAISLKEPGIIRRFVTDEVFNKLKTRIVNDWIVYNRLYLNTVVLLGAKQENGKNILMVGVGSSYQRVKLVSENKAEIIDSVMHSQYEVVFISRNIEASASKGSIYAHLCPNCGAPVKDSLDINCSHCGLTLNNPKNEWIISDIKSVREFKKSTIPFGEDLYDVRDYAFNNVMVMIISDGVISSKERLFALELAKKWGYNTDSIQKLIDMAMNRRLVIRMPQDPKKRQKIYDMMLEASQIDETIAPSEQALLNEIKNNYLQHF